MKKNLIRILAFPLLSANAYAADLMQVYRDAQANDPTFAAARANLDAGQEKTAQGRAGLLPSLTASANSTWNENKIGPHGSNQTKYPFNSNGYQVTLTQPLFRWQSWETYTQGTLQTAQAEANFGQARQDLILRVAQAYFDVLAANESLVAVKGNKEAIAQQLELAKKSFEVGTATITDTHEAQARYDLAVAQESTALSDLEVKKRTLQAILGKEPGPLAQWRPSAELSPPTPASMNEWVAAAEKDSLAVQVQKFNAEIADREVSKQRAGHYPTVDAVANYGHAKSLFGQNLTDSDFTNAGVQVNIPLFTGGLTASRTREASANRAAAEANLEATKRNAALGARQYYLGVANGLAQVKALKAAQVSSQSALESNKLGYEVGVRINIDVLNAENQLYQTRRDLAKATFDTVMAQLRLKAAVGSLDEADLQQINALLDPSNAQ